MIISKENIFEWLRHNNAAYWKLKTANQTFSLGESSSAGDLTVEGSIADLGKLLDLTGPGQYFIEAWATEGQKKERKKTLFEISYSAGHPVSGIGAINQSPVINVQDEVAKALNDYKKELKIEQLEAKVKELEAKNKELEADMDSAQNRIAERLYPVLGLLGGLTGNGTIKQTGVSGIDDDAQKRFETALEKWAANEPEILNVVEKIADMSEKDTQSYTMARGILLNQK